MAPTIFFLLLLGFICGSSEAQPPKEIPLGSSLSPADTTSWSSPSGKFVFGFYRRGNGFSVGIWLVGMDNNNTVVWTAKRDDPPVRSDAILLLTNDGKLLLQTEEGADNLIAADAISAYSASMLDSGNFVLYNDINDIIWQTFDHPTDTILGGQFLPPGGQLFSSSSETNHSSGRFRLKMQYDGNLVSYPINTGDNRNDAYWSSNTIQEGHVPRYHLYLNKTGSLFIRNATKDFVQMLFDNGLSSVGNVTTNSSNIIYRATLDSDGIFRLYAHMDDQIAKPVWWAVENPCVVHGFCGFNSYCRYNNNQSYCNCLTGFEFVDQNDKTLGCMRNFSESNCTGGDANAASYKMLEVDNMTWNEFSYNTTQMLIGECRLSCLNDCYCWAAVYEYEKNWCKKQKLPLKYVRRDMQWQSSETTASSTSTAFVKIGTKRLKNRYDIPPIPQPVEPPPIVVARKEEVKQITLVVLGFSLLLTSAIAVSSHLIYKIRVLKYKRLSEMGDLGLNEEVTLRIFSYTELKRATNDFREELGKGSFGAVYKGTLSKGRRLIAVKRLEKLVEEGEREFLAEMRAIGKTHHRNLVRLLGYCAEGSRRLLVYEYMSNGSLGKILFGAGRRPDWDERVSIALGVARGILYLHEECETPVIHCDIKPQNILMDEFWIAKISDFGLAKLLMPDQTRTFTLVRGTRGYMAPEWYKNTPISVKADVYSYGIVLLEIVCCRRNLEANVSELDEIVLSSWAYKCLVGRDLNKLVHWENVDKKVLENMVKVALWCIQDEPALRPTMKSVVLMLEGITDIAIPPCPTSDSV